jgi:hypothetical protein
MSTHSHPPDPTAGDHSHDLEETCPSCGSTTHTAGFHDSSLYEGGFNEVASVDQDE